MMKSSKIIIISLVVAALVFLIAQDLVWSGKLTVRTDFLKFTPYFSVLKPQDNIVMQPEGNYIKAEPIYFDLYLPRKFNHANIELEYKDEAGHQILLGPNIKAGWDIKPLIQLPSGSNDYKLNSMDFDLTQANINNGKLRFIISIPGLEGSKQGIYLKNIKVSLTRPPIWQEDFIRNLLNYFNYVIHLR